MFPSDDDENLLGILMLPPLVSELAVFSTFQGACDLELPWHVYLRVVCRGALPSKVSMDGLSWPLPRPRLTDVEG